MLNLENLSDKELLARTHEVIHEERKMTVKVLWHLRELERRQVFAARGFASLFDFCVQALGFSEGAASRRIRAMRLTREVPGVAKAIQSGQASLTTVSYLQSFLQQERKLRQKAYTAEEKEALLKAIENKTKTQCEKFFYSISPASALPRERARVISEELTELRFHADQELMNKLERVRGLLAHKVPGASYGELFHRMADIALAELDPMERMRARGNAVGASEVKAEEAPPAEAGAVSTSPENEAPCQIEPERRVPQDWRYIPVALRRFIWKRDQGKCTYVDPDTGRACTSRYGIEFDHTLPLAQGGTTCAENLRLLCRAHNVYEATQSFGTDVMRRYSVRLQ